MNESQTAVTPRQSAARPLLWCVLCLLVGGIVGYSMCLRSNSEHDYRLMREWHTMYASADIMTATEVLALIRANKPNEAETKLKEQITQYAAELREHCNDFTAGDHYYVDPALDAADAELKAR